MGITLTVFLKLETTNQYEV